MSEQNEMQVFTDELAKKVDAKIIEATKGKLSMDEAKNVAKTIVESSKEELNETIEAQKTEFNETVKKLTESIEALKQNQKKNAEIEKAEQIKAKGKIYSMVEKMLLSDEFEMFAKGKGQTVYSEKDIFDLTNDHTGDVMVTENSGAFAESAAYRKLSVREIIPFAGMTNKESEVYTQETVRPDWASNSTENGELNEVTTADAEKTAKVVRSGSYMNISDNTIKTLPESVTRSAKSMEDGYKKNEDFNLLYGAESADGLADLFGTIDFNTKSFVAGDISSIATFDGGDKTLVTFTDFHNLQNGETITFANTTGTTYDNTYDVNVRSLKTIVLDQAYTADASPGNWTADAKWGTVGAISSPTVYDVILQTILLKKANEVDVNGVLINPVQLAKMVAEKDSTNDYLKFPFLEKRGNEWYVMDARLIAQNAVKQDDIFVGEWDLANMHLQDYEQMTFTRSKDNTSIRTNETQFAIYGQSRVQVFRSYKFGYGKFSTIEAALTA